MENLKNLTARYLRDLARKQLGRGQRALKALKAKRGWWAALKKIVPGQHGAGPPAEAKKPPGPVEVVRFEKPMERKMEPPSQTPKPPRAELPPRAPGAIGPHADPLIEGFFVARVFGEDEARRQHLAEEQTRSILETRSALHDSERLPELPLEYQDDRVVLMARDPHSAYVYWDFHPDTRRAAFEGLRDPRVVLNVVEEGAVVRTLDAALESRGFYVYGLGARKEYRIEVHAVGADGSSRRIGPASNPVRLPADDVSADRTVRFMRVPWGMPLSRLKERRLAQREAERIPEPPPELLTITHSRWVPAANSGSWQLQMWNETLPRGLTGREALQPGPSIRELPLGGLSSWALQGSWRSSPGSGSGLGAVFGWAGGPSSKQGG